MEEETLSVNSHLINSQLMVGEIPSCDLIRESQGVLPTKSKGEEFVVGFVCEKPTAPVRKENNTT